MNNLYKIEVKKEGSEIVSVTVYHPDGTLLTTERCRGFDRAQEIATQAQRIRHLDDDEINLTIDCRGA